MKNKINKICITTRCEQCKNYMKCFKYRGVNKNEKKMDETKCRKLHKKS